MLYSLDLSRKSVNTKVEQKAESKSLLLSITAFQTNNWRWLQTTFYQICIYVYIIFSVYKQQSLLYITGTKSSDSLTFGYQSKHTSVQTIFNLFIVFLLPINCPLPILIISHAHTNKLILRWKNSD